MTDSKGPEPRFALGDKVRFGELGETKATVRAIMLDRGGITYKLSRFKESEYIYLWIDEDELEPADEGEAV